ncbi:hypothetical protein ACU10_10720 [Xanthomonas oryzae pv. oryzicola]|nr:hypothetical protein ACU10_10720 [Xanthomonas oryzae pv. oryzicola]AKO19797.1 hypothetical protein ACU11_10340 [Xanthomonas oryzae pv. oryzicola]PUE98237.1 hypothetical protein C7T79_02075 [Xanthomonas oryzae pv. oryzicola]
MINTPMRWLAGASLIAAFGWLSPAVLAQRPPRGETITDRGITAFVLTPGTAAYAWYIPMPSTMPHLAVAHAFAQKARAPRHARPRLPREGLKPRCQGTWETASAIQMTRQVAGVAGT